LTISSLAAEGYDMTIYTASDASGFINSNLKFAQWASMAGNYTVESFESVPPTELTMDFTVNGHTFTAGNSYGLSILDQPMAGMTAHSGTHYLHGGSYANGGASPVLWDLPSAQTGFGFFGTDVELGNVTITFVSGDSHTFAVEGTNFFWGILNTPQPVLKVTITPARLPNDAVGYDDFVVVPEPATICLLGLGALSFVSRKNNKKTQIVKEK
jgi:hypothetical protein